MRTIPVNLAAHMALGTTTVSYLLKVTRLDATVFAFTSADADVVSGGVTHRASPGLDVSSIVHTTGLAVDNLELTTLDDGSTFLQADVLGGLWRNAAFVISKLNRNSVGDGVTVLMVGTVGDVTLEQGVIRAELRGLQQYLQQPIGSVSSRTCRARVGDAMCTVNIPSLTVAGTVTGVTSTQVFVFGASGAAEDYFAEGLLTFTSGLNIGLAQKVKVFAADKTITLSVPMIQAVQIGDTFTVYPGCRKRLAEDCFTKFNNVVNFQGEPHLPGVDQLAGS
jgi:uncharacterized phage protein (TIGR02218 family)